jgi:hypothetical protein
VARARRNAIWTVLLLGVGTLALSSDGLSSALGEPIAARVDAKAQRLVVVLGGNGCSVSAMSASTVPIDFVVRNRSARVGRFAVAGVRSRALRPGASARLRLQLRGGRYGYRCTPRGNGSLLVVAASQTHRIVVQARADGRGQLADSVGGQPFVPRGSNYIQLGYTSDGQPGPYHTTFNSDAYDSARADRVLARMHADGYNTVRVFLNGACSRVCLAQPGGTLRDVYILEQRAVQADADFFHELAQRLRDDDAPLDALLAYELRSEVFANWDAPPLSLSSGSFVAANRRSYDLSNPGAKTALVSDGIVTFIDTARAAIRSVDPTALVTVGFLAVGTRPYDEARAALQRSSTDFVDEHF